MTLSKNICICLALGTSLLSLGACGRAMPTGYTYHHDMYKSASLGESSKVTIEQRKYMNEVQAEQFRDAVYDLLEKVTMRAGMPPKPVYILAPDPMTTFYANIDNDLRESMRHIGYAISDTPNDAYIFTYEAMSLAGGEEALARAANNVQLTLRVFSGLGDAGRQLTEETGQYFIQGAHEINVVPSRYSNLPMTQPRYEPVKQEAVVPPAPVVIEAPVVNMESSVVAAPPVLEPVSVPTPRVVSQPLVSVPDVRPEVQVTAPSMPKVSVTPPAISQKPSSTIDVAPQVDVSVSKPVVKVPSRNDIIIINRGDMPPAEVEMLGEGDNAIPTAKRAVRGRVSSPVEY